MLTNLWNTTLKPYLTRRDCFRRRSRLEDWLNDSNRAIQFCTIDLELSESHSGCNDIKAGSFLYLKPFKAFPADWRDERLYYLPTATILDLSRFADFHSYEQAVSASSHGNDNRSVKKAMRLGYRTCRINQAAYRSSIDRIHRSKLFRTGGLMLDALRPHADLADDIEREFRPPDCKNHWSVCWGAFKDETLAAYALLTRSGNIIRTIHVMGHHDALRDGAMKLLTFDVVRWLLEADTAIARRIHYFMYGALEHGGIGLMDWKLRLQFRPSLIDMSRAWDDVLPPEFSEVAYLEFNPDVRRAKLDPRLHYAVWGRFEGRRCS